MKWYVRGHFQSHFSKWLLSLLVLLLFSCDRNVNDDRSQVKIKLPSTQALRTAQSVSAQSGGWGVADPTTFNEIVCYGVAVEGPEPEMSNNQCMNSAGTVVMRPGRFLGAVSGVVPAGEDVIINMEVPSGNARTIYLIGFGASDATYCTDFMLPGGLQKSYLSAPHIISSVTRDLEPGEAEVDMVASLTGAIKYNDCTGPLFHLQPTGPDGLVINPPPPFDFGSVTSGSNVDLPLNVTNYGSSPATSLSGAGLEAEFSFTGGAYPGTGGDCSVSLAPGASCTLMINFAPSSVATFNDDVELSYENASQGAMTLVYPVMGTGSGVTPAVLIISNGPTHDFGTHTIATTTDFTFSVSNTGGQAATAMADGAGLAAPFQFKGGTYPGTGGDCGTTLGNGSSCNIVVTYSPSAALVSNDTIDLNYNDGSGAQVTSRDVTGTGVTPAVLSISEANPYDYGTITVGGSADHTFTVANSGGSAAISLSEVGLAPPFQFKGGTYPGTGGTCAPSLSAGGNCTLVITFSPVGTGLASDTIDLSYQDGAGPQNTTRDVQGTGVNAASLTISDGPTYDFGTHGLGSNIDHTFIVTNTGGATATTMGGSGLAAPFNFKGGSYPGAGGTCATTLAPAGSCNVVVTYSPTTSAVHNDTLQIDYNDGTGVQASTRDITGTGGHGPATQMVFTAQPTDPTVAGANIIPVIEIRDASSNIVSSGADSTATVTLSLFSGTGSLSGTLIRAAVGGVVTFSAGDTINIDLAGLKTIRASKADTSGGGGTAAIDQDSNSFTINHAPASQVVFATQPSDPTTVGLPLTPTVEIQDAFGNIVDTGADATANVTLSLFSGTGLLIGPVMKAAVGGVAIFTPDDNVYADMDGAKVMRATKDDTTGGGGTVSVLTNSAGFTINPGVGTWSAAGLPSAPSARTDHTAVWAGSKLIVWGGKNGGTKLNTGSIYDPTTNSWTVMSTAGAPTARYGHSAIWTGSKMIVWGGWNDSTHYDTGGIYDPSLDSWTATTTAGISGYHRKNHTAVWTGTRMLVFGGGNPTISSTSILEYDPAGDAWSILNPTGPPVARESHAAVWTGSEMIIWGGFNSPPLADGKRYNPATNTWSTMAAGGTARRNFAYAWTGSELIVWGGYDGTNRLNSGERYDPVANSWTLISGALPNAPSPRNFVHGAWTGTQFAVFGGITGGGKVNTGGLYDPVLNVWQAINPAVGAGPTPRYLHSLSWIGSRLMAWGGKDASEFGDGFVLDPQQTNSTLLQISAGKDHACAVGEGERLKCWGAGVDGRLGLGDTANRGDGPGEMGTNLPYVDLGTGTSALQVATGGNFTCALLANYLVKCFGNNSQGQLGIGSLVNMGDDEAGDSIPTVSLPSKAIQIAAGSEHACALLDNGTVYCWGRNDVGQTGKGATSGYEWTPVQVKDTINSGFLLEAQKIDVGDDHACALMKDGGLTCWGDNTNGQLGKGTSGDNWSYPQTVTGLNDGVQLIALGGAHSCATRYGELRCWGLNTYGQVGDGTTTSRTTPVVASSGPVSNITSGIDHTCGVVSGTGQCWGRGQDGQTGAENGGASITAPTDIVSISANILQFSTQGNFSCAYYKNSDLKCFGNNVDGELGQGNTTGLGTTASDMVGIAPIDLGF